MRKTMRDRVIETINNLPDRFSFKDILVSINIDKNDNRRRTIYKILGEMMIVGKIQKAKVILDDQKKSLYEKVKEGC